VIACYSERPNASRQCAVTVVMANGVEINGMAPASVVVALQTTLNDMTPPDLAGRCFRATGAPNDDAPLTPIT
jgi:hypothetical protein